MVMRTRGGEWTGSHLLCVLETAHTVASSWLPSVQQGVCALPRTGEDICKVDFEIFHSPRCSACGTALCFLRVR